MKSRRIFALLALFTVSLLGLSAPCHGQDTAKTYNTGFYSNTFNEAIKDPVASWYTFTAKNRVTTGTTRTAGFHPEPLIDKKWQASDKDYTTANRPFAKDKTKTWDRGHFTPDVAMRYNQKAEFSTMTFGNTAPQNSKMNETTWRFIEVEAFDFGLVYDSVKVLTGGIYRKPYHWLLPSDGVAIPDYYYKVIVIYSHGQIWNTEAWLCPNVNPKSQTPEDYVISIDSLSAEVGHDVCPWLPGEYKTEAHILKVPKK